MASTFQYPGVVSRTLDPSGKSLRTIVGMHDRQITDADINLIQDLQDSKLSSLVGDMGVTSGCLTYSSLVFNPNNPAMFFIPAFDILFNKQVVTIQGQQSSDITLNRVLLPSPPSWAPGVTEEDARIYIVFLELWYQALNPITGAGYYIDPPTGLRYFYPYGGILPDPSNAIISPDDSVDPFQGLFTTERAQIQWRLNVQRVALSYNFTKEQAGFFYTGAQVASPGNPGEIVYAQASRPGPIVDNIYKFTNTGTVNGDTGLWRAGDGNVNNSLGTMDGYSYGHPIAVVFQRNKGNFDLINNLYGCADPATPGSGTLSSRVSGRFDSRLADQVFDVDVVDTRSTVSLTGIDLDSALRDGFTDLVMGNTQLAIGRGESPGNKPTALGSKLAYYVAMAPAQIANTATVGHWDGFANGFSSDQRTFFSTRQITTSQKSTGVQGTNWKLNDSFSVALPLSSNAVISSVNVTALNSNATGKSPAALLQGQLQIDGTGSKAITVKFVKDLSGTLFDPGPNNLYVTLGVTYPAGSGIDTRKIPFNIQGGSLADHASGKSLPVYGISEYQVQQQQPALEALNVWAVSPLFSDTILGTKIWITVPGSSGVATTVGGVTTTAFTINCKGLNLKIGGLYCTRAWDFATGSFYTVAARSMSSLGPSNSIQHILTIQGPVDPASTVVISMLAQDTAQLAYNAPVKGIVGIEETVLLGNHTSDPNFPMDPRVIVESVSFDPVTNLNTIVLAANGCQIKGISGDDINRLIWVKNGTTLNAVTIQSTNFGNGTITMTVPGPTVLAGGTGAPFLVCGSILPAFDSQSSLVVEVRYIPYQGEGTINRDYEVEHAEDNALLTTNGTGSAPIIGLKDVYPYNRELPIASTLPAQLSWNDATLANAALATFFDSNYVAMRVNNVEHTFLAPLHTNDFIPPMNRDIRKVVRFLTAAGRGFATAIPHVGFAITPPTPRTVLGQNLQSTQAPITLFVNNLTGSDNNDGLSVQTPKLTITAAINVLPPVLRHPCVVILMTTGQSYNMGLLQNTLQIIALGEGDIRSAKAYALANCSRVIQNEGRLVISRQAGATDPILIDATGFAGFGDGPTYGFFVDTSRVIFNGLRFIGFRDSAIKALNADVAYVDCEWVDNVQAGSYEQCDSVILDRGSITLPDSGVGHVMVSTVFTAKKTACVVRQNTNPGPFFVAGRGSTVNLETHGTGSLDETNISAITVIVEAQLNSSIVVTGDYQSAGSAVLEANSVLARTVSVNPFLGGVTADLTSGTVTQL